MKQIIKENRPKIGTKMYSVHEHRYHLPSYYGPVLEYVVCESVVTEFYAKGKQIKLVGKSPEGYQTPYIYKLREIGKQLFYTPAEAAELAQRETQSYECRWNWLGEPDIPMRRTWLKYLGSNQSINNASEVLR